jgi:hypothetical protein
MESYTQRRKLGLGKDGRTSWWWAATFLHYEFQRKDGRIMQIRLTHLHIVTL